eukprot:2476660-Amphidinium_carterae.1
MSLAPRISSRTQLSSLLSSKHLQAANLMDMMDKIVARPSFARVLRAEDSIALSACLLRPLPTVPESCSAVLKRLSAALLERDPDRRQHVGT